jgi:hypothetical protein
VAIFYRTSAVEWILGGQVTSIDCKLFPAKLDFPPAVGDVGCLAGDEEAVRLMGDISNEPIECARVLGRNHVLGRSFVSALLPGMLCHDSGAQTQKSGTMCDARGCVLARGGAR